MEIFHYFKARLQSNLVQVPYSDVWGEVLVIAHCQDDVAGLQLVDVVYACDVGLEGEHVRQLGQDVQEPTHVYRVTRQNKQPTHVYRVIAKICF